MEKIRINNFDLYYIPDEKFKSFMIGCYFFSPLEEKDLSFKSLLSNYLTKCNQTYPSFKSLSRHLKSLYGMDLYCNYGRNGLVTTMNFVVRSINDLYLNEDEHLFENAVLLLKDTITKPYFEEELVDLEKNLLLEDIKRLYDNKEQYATRKFLDLMFPNESCRFSSIGKENEVKEINLDNLKENFNKMLTNERVFFVIGNIEISRIKEAFSKIELPDVISYPLEFIDYETKEISEVNEVIEDHNSYQSIVYMGYRSEIRICDELYKGMFLLSNMLGGFFHSSLFQEVREKRSLAYSVGSDYNSRKGNFVIYAGISSNKFEEFKQVVSDVLEEYKNGFIDEEVFELTKKSLVNEIYKSADKQTYELSRVFSKISGLPTYSIEEKVSMIQNTSKEEVIKAANCLVLDTVFLLRGNS